MASTMRNEGDEPVRVNSLAHDDSGSALAAISSPARARDVRMLRMSFRVLAPS